MHLLNMKWAVPWVNAVVLAGLILTVCAGASGASEAIVFHKKPRPHFRNISDRWVTVAWCNKIEFTNGWEYDTCRGAGEVKGSVLGSLSFVQPEEWFGYWLLDFRTGRSTEFRAKEGFGHLTVRHHRSWPPTPDRTDRRYILVKNAHLIGPGESLYMFDPDAERAIISYRYLFRYCNPGVSRWIWVLFTIGGNWQIPWNVGRGKTRCNNMPLAFGDMLRVDGYAKVRSRLQSQAPSYPVYCRKGGSPWRVCSRD